MNLIITVLESPSSAVAAAVVLLHLKSSRTLSTRTRKQEHRDSRRLLFRTARVGSPEEGSSGEARVGSSLRAGSWFGSSEMEGHA